MKKIICMLVGLLVAPFLVAQEGAPSAAEMVAMMKLGKPGEEHKLLEKMVGEWEVETSVWMSPGAEPTKTMGSLKSETILGGLYIMSTHHGSTMGMDYEGLAINGYDNNKKAYTLSWCSSMESGVTWAEGVYDKESKTINYKGTMFHPMMGGDVKYRFATTFLGPGKMLDTMYMEIGGQEIKTMEMASTLKK